MAGRMNTAVAIAAVALGVFLLGSAAAALLRGRIWVNPKRLKPERRWRPGRWITRDADPFQFWLGVVLYTLVGAAAVATGVSWLRN